MNLFKQSALTLSVALFGSAYVTELAANKKVEVAVALFHKQIEAENPNMHWEDFSHCMGELLSETEYKDAAKALHGLKEEKNPTKVGLKLFANIKKMPGAIQDTIKRLIKNTAALKQRFEKSLRVSKLHPDERTRFVSDLLAE